MDFAEPRGAIYDALISSPELLDVLAANRAWENATAPATKENSIVPMDKIDTLVPPFIGVMAGNWTRTGEVTHDVFFYIRCYNTMDKTYVDIDKALSLVYRQLHRKNLLLDNGVNVTTLHEQTLLENVDEALNLRYRESQYRLVVI